MADGSSLQYSANSGNSNFYLYNNGTSQSTTPASGFITYNNATQSSATIIYISHITRDNVDIEVFFKQITTITETITNITLCVLPQSLRLITRSLNGTWLYLINLFI